MGAPYKRAVFPEYEVVPTVDRGFEIQRYLDLNLDPNPNPNLNPNPIGFSNLNNCLDLDRNRLNFDLYLYKSLI